MKTIKNIIILLCSLTIIISCEKEDSEFIASESNAIQLEELDISTIVIDGSNPTNPAITLNWSNADFSLQAVENYVVQFSSTDSFSEIVSPASTSGRSSVTLTMSELNGAANNAGLDPLVSGQIFARVIASIGDQSRLPTISNTINFNVVPSFNYSFTDLYLVGPASFSGWDNNNNNSVMFRSSSNPDLFSYTGFFIGGQPLKVLEQRGAWAPQYGEDAPGSLIRRTTEDDPDPTAINDIESLSDGYYTFEVNLNDMSFSLNSYDVSDAPVYNTITIEGSAVDGSVQMQSAGFNQEEHIWRISSTTLSAGNIQFIVDGTAWGGDTEFSGIASSGSSETPVIVGDDYEIWFNDLTGEYQFIPLTLSQ